MNKFDNAVEFAFMAHARQYRRNFMIPYIIHPLEVVKLLNKFGANDEETLIVALLHDVLEDNKSITYEHLNQEFGLNVANYVRELTFVAETVVTQDKLEFSNKEAYLKSFKDKSIVSLVVKIADRICNVYDFMDTDPKYAVKYFRKADSLFKIMFDRMGEIEIEYGVGVPTKIDKTYNQLLLELNKIDKRF